MKECWKYFEKYPPWMVRLLARRRTGVGTRSVRDLSDQEIAIRAEMPVARVCGIYNLRSWDHVTLSDVRNFCRGCGFDPLNGLDRNRAMSLARSSPRFAYLKRSRLWETLYLPLIKRMERTAHG